MSDEEIVQLIFEDRQDMEVILSDLEELSIYESVLKYGLSTKKFLYLDYRGEQSMEIVNYILDYEFAHNLELASREELEKLGEFEYEYVPDKIKEVNNLIYPKKYGLFAYPTGGDYYALFIAKLEHKSKLLREDLLVDEWTPPKERCIQYYY
ncbi:MULTISPECIES: DUF6630 family protein [Paenibacillus]|uniref:DUF6630 domain-containing protein n=2 Tax=Paenibacillus TaxID=44249 RepID=A0ABX2Z507_PAEPO|nr:MULTISPECIES: hypothetical protein [Paenibacillus]MDR6777239.1 hypothetical protein [Paenibacillus peoriae]ODA06264.1 hypothetical protein A7312_15280 [Paenibacillus polymyxa]OME66175.1 hypothetical protein BK119_22720 [Paenibacillus peoriae]OMF35017.1 hypothetical protein BK134_07215 [Paenibacillus peoriae]